LTGALAVSIPTAICGAGFGCFRSPNLRALMSSALRESAGGASGTITTSRLLGQTTAAALTALCFSVADVQGSTNARWRVPRFGRARKRGEGLRRCS
jgi:DHA2 family multidrug resistance protein-like MFS transporter